jgi:hypothetical protein
MTSITEKRLRQIVDFDEDRMLIRHALSEVLESKVPEKLVRFFARYISWNGFFGAGVATLAGKIARARRLFVDPEEPFVPAADRSVLVASYFFDAARDEFDDHESRERDPHRNLAQAFLKGLVRETLSAATTARCNELAADPLWLTALNGAVATGYGAYGHDDLPTLFSAMGYHLGSEILADQEFSIIDQILSSKDSALVQRLRTATEQIGPVAHNAYVWIEIHSGTGGAAEADHFAWATQGVNLALGYVDPALREELCNQTERGFLAFANDQREFFNRVNKVA